MPKVEEVIKPEYDSDDEDEKKKVVEEDPADIDDEYRYTLKFTLKLKKSFILYQPSSFRCNGW